MRIGNVIKDPNGGMWIVSEIDDRIVQAVSFDAENVSAVQQLEDHDRNETCSCGDNPERMGEPEPDCEDCHGEGRYVEHVKGWKRSKVLASNVQEFMMTGVKRMMRLK